jgi:hypothetical protein
MPNRILKESVCTSPNLEGLTWFEEVCFYRLIVQCDDYGRMDARPAILRSRLFPLKEDIGGKALGQALTALEWAGLVAVYEVQGRPYLQMCTWEDHQRVRNKRSKYPPPPWLSDNGQPSAVNCLSESESESQSESQSVSEAESLSVAVAESVS